MAHIRLDDSRFPIVMTEMEGQLAPEQAEGYCEAMAEVIARRQMFATLTDLTHASLPSLKVRSVFKKFIERHQQESDRHTICAALVIDNPVLKMAVQALYHLKKTAFPQRAFRTRTEALGWIEEQLAQGTSGA